MRKYFIIAGALAALVVPSAALADVSTNGTTNSAAHGYSNANHIADFNGDHNGIGWIRSTQSGKTPGSPPAAATAPGGHLRRHAGRLHADQQQRLSKPPSRTQRDLGMSWNLPNHGNTWGPLQERCAAVGSSPTFPTYVL